MTMKTEVATNMNTTALTAHNSVLRGKRVLLVGGDPRPSQQQAMEDGLGVAELRWLETRPTTSLSRLRKYVASEQYDVVIVAVRWARYGFGGLAKVCRRHGIAFVRLPSGINSDQIAFQARDQIGQRLSAL